MPEHFIRVRVIEAKDLIAADSNGFSDPYAILLVGKEKRKTSVVKKNLNPSWHQVFNIPAAPSDILKVTVMDKDTFSKDDFIGEITIPLTGLIRDQEKVEWHRLGRVKSGEIRIGITALTFDTSNASNSSNMPNQPTSYPTVAPQQGYMPSYAQSPTMTHSANIPYMPPYAQSPSTNYASSMPSTPQSSKQVVGDSASREGYTIHYHELNFEKKIGSGAYGEVWKGEWAGTPVAIKKILKADISEADLDEFSREILLTSKLRHPNITQFLGACMEPEFCLVSEFMDKGTLFDVIQNQEPMDWSRRVACCLDIAKGMMYLHSRNPPIVHRDIKSLNILVAKDWKCTITDFGLTKMKDKAMLSTRCGSPAWSAPEVLRGEQYDEKADVYSYAIVMWEIIAQQPPYRGLNPNQVIGQVAFQSPGMRPQVPACPYPALINLMVRCWDDNPNVRCLFPEILHNLKGIASTVTN